MSETEHNKAHDNPYHLASSVLRAFMDNSAFDDYAECDGWTWDQYMSMLSYFDKKLEDVPSGEEDEERFDAAGCGCAAVVIGAVLAVVLFAAAAASVVYLLTH